MLRDVQRQMNSLERLIYGDAIENPESLSVTQSPCVISPLNAKGGTVVLQQVLSMMWHITRASLLGRRPHRDLPIVPRTPSIVMVRRIRMLRFVSPPDRPSETFAQSWNCHTR